ncbi:ferritin-like domain-containing protein [Paraburkholderia sacchari]|uniref:ferritin-like domain-containing protein n=1 Tax=Paraburkholderia sacchari TaxID=159450 RepID=UPI001BCCD25E|nr:ferritin-like protein [Paraburkholderia sacchari]
MLKIRKEVIARLRAADSVEEVQTMLSGAMSLELSTIPPYLTALFSIKAENREARALVHSIVVEEMLHMTLAGNTLIAIGGNPKLLEIAQQLQYPGPLPMCIDEGLTVTLGSLTKPQVGNVFMTIERPATKAILPGETRLLADAQASYDSIGDFYAALIDKLAELVAAGQPIFAHPRLEQQIDISKWFPPEIERFPDGKVSSLESARVVLETIVRQGEGMQIREDKINPKADPDGNYAHYFKFGEIFYGHRLVPDGANPSGWSYTGEPVPLDESNIVNLYPNAALSDYPQGSGAYIAGKQFYEAYRSLLVALDQTFNGQPERLDAALGIMFELKLVAQQVMQFQVGAAPSAVFAAPPFMLTHVAP